MKSLITPSLFVLFAFSGPQAVAETGSFWGESAYQALDCGTRGIEQEFGKCYDFCYGQVKEDAIKTGSQH